MSVDRRRLWRAGGIRGFCGIIAFFSLAALGAEAHAAHTMTAAQNYYRGRYLEAAGRMTDAVVHYNEVVRIGQEELARGAATRNTYVLKTRALRRLGRHSEVLVLGRQGMRVFPDEFRLLETMGQSHFFLGDFARSLDYMERYAAAMPDGDRIAIAYFFIGEIFRLTGKFHRADMAYTTALHLEPGMPLWWYRLGTVREQVGDREPAIEAFQQALRLNPNHGGARGALLRLGD